MRIYLLNPPYLKNFNRCGRWPGSVARGGTLDYPKWLAYCTGVLSLSYTDIRLIDAPARKWSLDDVIDDANRFKPDLIVVETNFASLKNDVSVASKLKEIIIGAKTVMVGPPVSQLSDMILMNDSIDFIARYEYDFTIRDLADALDSNRSLNDIKGLSFKSNGRVTHNPDREYTTSEDLDLMPFVSRVYKAHLNIKDYFLSQSLYPEVQIFTGRGCPFKCAFCSWPVTLMGRVYRFRSPENIVDEFQYIRDELPEVREIFIEDDTFTINKRLVREVCERLKKRKIDVAWSCNARATLDYQTMREMKKAGCRLVIVGYESGNDSILKEIRKGTNVEQMRRFTKDAKRARLMIHGDFIFGLPGETKDTVNNTMKFIKKIKPNVLQVAIATPIPGTEFYSWARNHGYMLVDNMTESNDENGYQRCIISYPELSREDIEACVVHSLKSYYLSPAFIPVAVSNVIRKNGFHELKTMMMSAKIFFKYIGGKGDDR